MTLPSDRIEIRDLELLCLCGVLPEETERRQPFMVDLDLYLDLAPAGQSDDLTRTVNYGELIDTVVDEVEATPFSLLEAMAEHIAGLGLAYEVAEAVTVTVRKLRPPVAAHVSTTGVTITRTRRPSA